MKTEIINMIDFPDRREEQFLNKMKGFFPRDNWEITLEEFYLGENTQDLLISLRRLPDGEKKLFEFSVDREGHEFLDSVAKRKMIVTMMESERFVEELDEAIGFAEEN